MAEQQSTATAQGRDDAPDAKLSDVSSVRVGGRNSEVPANRVLQRVIFPRDEDPLDVRPLYVDEPSNASNRSRGCVTTSSSRGTP